MSIWSHGKYIDLWSLVHFLSGIMLSGIAFLFFDSLWAFVFVLVIATLWEVFEAVIGIGENASNYLTDIVIALIGYFGTHYIYFGLNRPFSQNLLVAIVLFTGTLSLWGFLDFKKLGKL